MPLQNTKVVWEPLPGSQQLALSCPCNAILYTGTRGPGKTDTQLMYFRSYVGCGYGPFWRGIIFGREYKELDDLVSKSKRWFREFDDGAEFKEAKSDYKWVWPTGEELLFRAADNEAAYWLYHGQEFPYIAWNELTNHKDLKLYDMMMSCNRSSYTPAKDGFIHPKLKRMFNDDGIQVPNVSPFSGTLPDPIPLRVFSTTNPHGVGHAVVKRRFIDVAPFGHIVRVKSIVYSPALEKDVEVERTQVALEGHWRENKYLDVSYIANLLSDPDPNRRAAWAGGSWDIIAGGPFDDVWDEKHHKMPRIIVPSTWYVNRAFDWGSTEPGAYGLWAEASGEEAKLEDGTTFCPPPGSLFQIGELYSGSVGNGNVGDRRGARQWARDILAYENDMREAGWIQHEVLPGPADNQIRSVRDSDTDTIEKLMQDEGVFFTVSDKSPGSRGVGLELMRQRMTAHKVREGAGIAWTWNCAAAIGTIPVLPRDPKKADDVVSSGVEDHMYDQARYRVLEGNNRYATVVPGGLPR